MRSMILLILTGMLVAGCGGAAAPAASIADRTAAPTPTVHVPERTPAPAARATPTTPPATAVRAATPTPAAGTAVPDAVKIQALDTYKLLILIQANANLLDETARRVASGELAGTDSLAAVIVVAALVNAVDEAASEHTPPALLQSFWDAALPSHARTRQLTASWFNQELTADQVVAELAASLNDIEATLSGVDDLLQTTYAVDRSDLQALRSQVMADFRRVLDTPTPDPDSAAGPVLIVSDASYTEGDYLHIIGEVQNTGAAAVEYVKIVATLYGAGDTVIGTQATYTIVDVIAPAGKSPFEITTSDWEGMTHYKLQLQSSAGASPDAPVRVVSHQERVADAYYRIVGEVVNEGVSPMEYVKVIATLYDAADQVAGVAYAYTALDVIPPGGRAPFELTTDHWTGASRSALQVQASPGALGRQDLVVKSHQANQDDNYLSIVGEVENTGATAAEYVKVVVTCYDGAGAVVATAFTYTELDTLPAGGTSPFEVLLWDPVPFERYAVQVQGQ